MCIETVKVIRQIWVKWYRETAAEHLGSAWLVVTLHVSVNSVWGHLWLCVGKHLFPGCSYF